MPIKASCHCGATQFEVSEAPTTVTECNCTFCFKRVVLWAYYLPEQVSFIKNDRTTAIPTTHPPTSIMIVQSAGAVLTTRCIARGATTVPISPAHRLPSMRDYSMISTWQPYRLNTSMAGICGRSCQGAASTCRA